MEKKFLSKLEQQTGEAYLPFTTMAHINQEVAKLITKNYVKLVQEDRKGMRIFVKP